MKTDVTNATLLDDADIEKGFNDALESLQKSLNPGKAQKYLLKSKDEVDDAEEEDEDEPAEEDEDEDEGMRKSIPDILAEDPESAAAMDVEPFLLQLAKAMDETMGAVMARVAKVETLVKSQASLSIASAQLQKSTRDMVKVIGESPVSSGTLRRLEKSSRFDNDGQSVEVNNMEVLSKSRDWLKTGKIDIVEAGMIEGRINKGLLFKQGDRIDQKVTALIGEGK